MKRIHSLNLSRKWDLIVPGFYSISTIVKPGKFPYLSYLDGFFCYTRTDRRGAIYGYDKNENLVELKNSTGYRNNWDIVLSGDFGGGENSLDDLFYYSRTLPPK